MHHLQTLGSGGAVKIFPQTITKLINESINDGGVCGAMVVQKTRRGRPR